MLITFGIYSIYWHFVVGGRIQMLGGRNNGVIYGILYLLGMLTGITALIAMLMIQNDINNLPENTGGQAA